jgi:hypothetical protein
MNVVVSEMMCESLDYLIPYSCFHHLNLILQQIMVLPHSFILRSKISSFFNTFSIVFESLGSIAFIESLSSELEGFVE